MGMTVAQLERTMSTQELMWHAAEYRLTAAEQKKARDRANTKGRL